MAKDALPALAEALRSLVATRCVRTLAGNSIALRFGFQDDPEGTCYLWIVPPWRLMLGDGFVMGSADCPSHDDYESREDYSRAFILLR